MIPKLSMNRTEIVFNANKFNSFWWKIENLLLKRQCHAIIVYVWIQEQLKWKRKKRKWNLFEATTPPQYNRSQAINCLHTEIFLYELNCFETTKVTAKEQSAKCSMHKWQGLPSELKNVYYTASIIFQLKHWASWCCACWARAWLNEIRTVKYSHGK